MTNKQTEKFLRELFKPQGDDMSEQEIKKQLDKLEKDIERLTSMLARVTIVFSAAIGQLQSIILTPPKQEDENKNMN